MEHRFKRADWSYDTNIYEVNIRQYTAEGTIRAFARHLPRLRNMGVEIIWLMPVTPISKEKRIGSLGSYYACSDYTDINPEFGTMDDFKELVVEIHALGMKVIIDWVANHTGWDHIWTRTHPEFYKKNMEGQFYDNNNWQDVIDLNYYDQHMREEMIRCMKFWITECDIDGFRCDMAHLVPLDFWLKARRELDNIKELFWLAETEQVNYNLAFDAVYAWEWMHQTEKYRKNQTDIDALMECINITQESFPSPASHLLFTSNHDENSYNGTEYEKYGDSAAAMAVFAATWHGIPLIYSGQEIPNRKRLKFFDKDAIDWSETPELHSFYQTLLFLRKTNPALKAGKDHSKTNIISINNNGVIVYQRQAGPNRILVVLNLSADCHDIDYNEISGRELYRDVFDHADEAVTVGSIIQLEPGAYRVYESLHN